MITNNMFCLKQIGPCIQELDPARARELPANPERDIDWIYCQCWFHLNMLREVQIGAFIISNNDIILTRHNLHNFIKYSNAQLRRKRAITGITLWSLVR